MARIKVCLRDIADVEDGGTGITSYDLGDMIYASAADTLSALAGNTTTTRKYLSQIGNGAVSAAPTWESGLIIGDGVAKITVGTTEPLTPSVGDLFVDIS